MSDISIAPHLERELASILHLWVECFWTGFQDLPSSDPSELTSRAHCRCAAGSVSSLDKCHSGTTREISQTNSIHYQIPRKSSNAYNCPHTPHTPCTPQILRLDHVLHLEDKICVTLFSVTYAGIITVGFQHLHAVVSGRNLDGSLLAAITAAFPLLRSS